jgi:energy-coupling factor transporter ATP-binding protein EcfA2
MRSGNLIDRLTDCNHCLGSPGELVVVDGPAASGKTALLLVAQLLARPNKGEVRLGFGTSQPVRVHELTHDYAQIQRQIGVVSSLSQQLFRTTLETNLCLGAHAPVSVQVVWRAKPPTPHACTLARFAQPERRAHGWPDGDASRRT